MSWETDVQNWLDDLPDDPIDWHSAEGAELVIQAMDVKYALGCLRAAQAKGMAQPDDFPGYFS